MPLYKDEKGGSHFAMNPQVGKAKFGSKPGGESPKKQGDGGEMTTGHGTSATFLHAHGDGTFHTEHEGGGERTEHPSLGHALTHMANHHEPGGKHTHIHSEGGIHKMHTVDENGNHEGDQDHQSTDELKSSLDKFLGEEGQEGHPQEDDAQNTDQQDGGNSDLSHLV